MAKSRNFPTNFTQYKARLASLTTHDRVHHHTRIQVVVESLETSKQIRDLASGESGTDVVTSALVPDLCTELLSGIYIYTLSFVATRCAETCAPESRGRGEVVGS